MAILQLDITENRPDGQAANERGELTDWQREWLVKQLKNPRQPRILLSAENANIAETAGLVLFVAVGFVLKELTRNQLTMFSWLLAIVLSMLLYVGIGHRGTIRALWKRRRFSARIRPPLRNAYLKLATGNYQIESWNGPVRFIMFPPGTYHMFGIESFEDTYVIATSMHNFPVSKAMWESLRPHAENDFILHYLSEPVPTLLSIAHIPRSEPPTDAELSAVIGIGDDGELIYAEQDGEARRQL
jgi:hypothetical protein